MPKHVRRSLSSTRRPATARPRVVTSERPYRGDIAHVVAEGLPGPWDVDIEHYPDGTIPAHLLDWVWEAGPALSTLSKYRTSCAAVLRDGGGTELLLTERLWDGSYLVGTLLPSPDHVHIVGTGAPRTIIATTAHGAAVDVRSRLLPEFEQLVLLARLREVQEDLQWVRDAEPGSVDAVDLEAALERFLSHAPYLIEATRRANGKTLPAPDAAVLVRFESLLAPVQGDSRTRGRGEPGDIDAAIALWLESGENLVDVVRASADLAEKPSHPAIATATPPKPPTAVAATGRTR
ncbi:hypothetical protein AB0K57_20865 [Streptomyces halstedii]|uniref:hypothetical protein n=1 Tax=Streptomyces halstedii TaxID=1944 RepID=UPI0034613607